jgi:hypothetical protein
LLIIIAGLQGARLQTWDDHHGAGAVDTGAFEWLTACVLDAIDSGARVEPTGLRFLLRRYAATDSRELGDAFGRALASVMAESRLDPVEVRACWLMLFTETCALSDDARLRTAAADLVTSLREEWSAGTDVDQVAHALDACLAGSEIVGRREVVPAAIDQLERIIVAAYWPGEGIGGSRTAAGCRTRCWPRN